jgi:hypothetical protein
MKQVVFAIALLAMASLTGCLTDDETTDTTYKPSKNSSINIPDNMTVTKNGNTLTTECVETGVFTEWEEILISDADSNLIWAFDPDNYFIRMIYVNGNVQWDSTEFEYGWEACTSDDHHDKMRLNIDLPQEPVRFSVTEDNGDIYAGTF